ncbi:TIM-barrel domain-containing protein [Flavicella sp.]|uniref:glycoside hydrolase family 31 protein n=1 Tax=Flavicella sp. TaxID=2957742 RepID=UPI0030166465
MFKSIIYFLLVFFVTISQAQNNDRIFKSTLYKNNSLEIILNDGSYNLKFYSNEIIETSFIPLGEVYSKKSHAVVLENQAVKTNFKETNDLIRFSSGDLDVRIQKKPFQINYSYQNKQIISENIGYILKDSLEVLNFVLDEKEVLYGGGARALGMNRRGHRLELYNKADYGYETQSKLMNFTMPIVLSSKRYMIHFDNAQIGWLDLDSKKNNSLNYETIGGRKTYQVIVGESWEELLNSYTKLTGKQPLPPRWVFGNFASRFGYHSEEETRNVVNQFREDKIPLDAIILDLYWFGKDIQGTMGNFEFLKDSFPTPKKMIADFKDLGVKTVLITEPFVLTTSKKWDDAVEKDILAKNKKGKPYVYDFYFGSTGLIDIFKEEGKNWFWEIYKKHTDWGIAGWWGDLGEPEVHPKDLLHAKGTADEVHNVYGHYWAKLVSDGYQKDFSEQRPFILMRAGYSGSQRFGMIPWSGDVNRTWGGLQSQMEIALQMGMQGMAYMHSDLGGFAGSYEDDELYVRWLQYGVFQPVFRPHAQEELASEPIFKKEKTKALAKKAIELRYQLLPYNYTMSFENNQKGIPLMRPLLFEEPNNEQLFTLSDTYLWGKDILVHPVVQKGQQKANVYFPSTNNWFDFYTDKKYTAGSEHIINLKNDKIPTFVRAGAFIPRIKTIQTTDDYSLINFDLHFYYDNEIKESKGQLYNDNGKTPKAYEKGAYELFHFKSDIKRKTIKISIKSEIGILNDRTSKNVHLIVHNISKVPTKVLVNGKASSFEYTDGLLKVKLTVTKQEKIKICL